MEEVSKQRWLELSQKVQSEMNEWRKLHAHATLAESAEAWSVCLAGLNLPFEEHHLPLHGRSVMVASLSSLQETSKMSSKRPEKTDGFPFREHFSLPLWERIRAWCQYADWYGPDWLTAASSSDLRTGFAFLPATDEQLRQTEQRMGSPHPPLLRALYLHVANGGFGPWEGLIGIPGGSATLHLHDPRYEETMKDDSMLLCDLEQREMMADDARLICLTEREWPTHFFNVCRGQEEEGFYVHAKSGRVYLAGNAWNRERTLTGEPATTLLHRQADSLEEWFERWLAGKLPSRYYSDEPVPMEKGQGRHGLVDEFNPFLDASPFFGADW